MHYVELNSFDENIFWIVKKKEEILGTNPCDTPYCILSPYQILISNPKKNWITRYSNKLEGLKKTAEIPCRCYYEKLLQNYAVNLQGNIHAEVWFQ